MLSLNTRPSSFVAAPASRLCPRFRLRCTTDGGIVRLSELSGLWMGATQLVCAIGVSFWSAVATGHQTAPAVTLSEALRVHVRNERFDIVTSIRGLPLGVRDALQTLFGGLLDIAEPGAEFQVTDV